MFVFVDIGGIVDESQYLDFQRHLWWSFCFVLGELRLRMSFRRCYSLFIRMSPLYECKNAIIYEYHTVYSYISIANLLFGSDNLTGENNLIVFRNVQKYIHHTNRFE